MGGGPSLIRRPTSQKSNTELTSALRASFLSAQYAQQVQGQTDSAAGTQPAKNGAETTLPYSAWTTREGDKLYIPSTDFGQSGLAEERSQYEITVKLFYLPNSRPSCRCAQTRDAIKLVLQELHMPSIDLLIISFSGISFDAEDEDEDEDGANGHAKTDTSANGSCVETEDANTMIKTWRCLEELHDEGVIVKLGVAEFGTERLARCLQHARIRPSVNQINVRDCCVVPKPLILYAKKEKIELLTHSDCTNILPTGTVRELLGPAPAGVGVLSAASSHDKAGGADMHAPLNGNVEPQWVIKYTAVVKDRGVVENKGYFAMAEIAE